MTGRLVVEAGSLRGGRAVAQAVRGLAGSRPPCRAILTRGAIVEACGRRWREAAMRLPRMHVSCWSAGSAPTEPDARRNRQADHLCPRNPAVSVEDVEAIVGDASEMAIDAILSPSAPATAAKP